MVHLTRRKLEALIRDEGMATREYAKLGFEHLSRDEAKHKVFLMRLRNLV